MSVTEAHEALIQYLSDRKKFRDDKRHERIRDNMGSSFDEADYTGDLTATLRHISQVNLSRQNRARHSLYAVYSYSASPKRPITGESTAEVTRAMT